MAVPRPSTEPAPTAASWVARPELDVYGEDSHEPMPQPLSDSEPVRLPRTEPQPGAEPGRLVESIAALLASGEAWAATEAAPAVPAQPVAPAPVPTAPAAPQSVAEPPVASPVSTLAMLPPVATAEPVAASGPLLVPDVPVQPVPARAYDPLTDALPVPLEATGPALLARAVELELDSFALAGAATSVPSQPSGRVQLGFRDGSTASLAPDSEQAAALEELAQLLNRRD